MTDINKKLQKLANINEDACEFYEEAEKRAESPQLKNNFRQLRSLHKGVVINLEDYIRAGGSEPDTDETFGGETREIWGKLMASISNDVDETLVTHLEEAEDRCLHTVKNLMQSDDISPETKALLQSEYQALQKSHDYMKALKDCMKAA